MTMKQTSRRPTSVAVLKGYDVNYAWGMGVHRHDMGGAMLPEMMRWLWRDHRVSVDPRDTVERSFRK
jgi:enterochelin esterase family protein